ncbi:MAG: pseudouridine synthase [Bacteroidales bacterium]|nr:pseudouridine synthase [Bacteroidales bacterium]
MAYTPKSPRAGGPRRNAASREDRPTGGARSQSRGARTARPPFHTDDDERPERRSSRPARTSRTARPGNRYERPDGREERAARPTRFERSERPARRPARPYDEDAPRRGRTARPYGEPTPRRRPQAPARTADTPERNAAKKSGAIRLNRYIALSGVCSRREADELIATGAVTVNGQICTVLGTLVKPEDKVVVGGEKLKAEKKVYLLMNKPKGYITTLDDPQQRHTVMELIGDACPERIYPVGRLDRNTTGVLLFTNDGDMAKKLTHPSHGARKIYHVGLDRPFAKADMEALLQGLTLEDGPVEVDDAEYVEDSHRKEVGVQIHSGRNRIVRRIFEHLGYKVCKLDRVLFAELTKKNLARGEWRFLTDAEVRFLQMNK